MFERSDLNHPAWLTLAGTGVAYGLVLAVLFGLLFVVPYLLFAGT